MILRFDAYVVGVDGRARLVRPDVPRSPGLIPLLGSEEDLAMAGALHQRVTVTVELAQGKTAAGKNR